MSDKYLLNEDELGKVSGGVKSRAANSGNKAVFEAAWNQLKLDKSYSGMKRAEIYDDWERDGCPEPLAYLAKYTG